MQLLVSCAPLLPKARMVVPHNVWEKQTDRQTLTILEYQNDTLLIRLDVQLHILTLYYLNILLVRRLQPKQILPLEIL